MNSTPEPIELSEISDDRLGELGLLDELGSFLVQLGERCFVSNPFWTDPTDPASDPGCQLVARHVLFHSTMRAIERKKEDTITAKGLVQNLAGKRMMKLLGQAAVAQFMGQGPERAVQSFSDSIYEVSNAHNEQAQRGLAYVCNLSEQRYQEWLNSLRDSDRLYYAQIMNWHQQQELINVAYQQIALSERQLQALYAANRIADRILRTSDEMKKRSR